MSLYEILFGCTHKKYSFPITRKRVGTYVVCLDCGKEMDYDWDAMKIVSPEDVRVRREEVVA